MLASLLSCVAELPADDLAAWEHLPPRSAAPDELVVRTAALIFSRIAAEERPQQLCRALGAVNLVLAHGTGAAAQRVGGGLQQLEGVYNILLAYAAKAVLVPRSWAKGSTAGGLAETPLLKDALRLPLMLLARCLGIEAISARELLGLVSGDVALAVATAVASLEASDWTARDAPQHASAFRACVWRMLHQLSSPQYATELALGAAVVDGAAQGVRIEEMLSQQVAHAHRLAACVVQFSALDAVAASADDSKQREPVVAACLRLLHNLVASPRLAASAQLMARHVAARWASFGMRILAPHLRRLLGLSAEGGPSALAAQRELRHHLRTLGWMLHHCSGLRELARPLCTELALRALRGGYDPRSLAVIAAVAANSGALAPGGQLHLSLGMLDAASRSAIQEELRQESRQLWLSHEAQVDVGPLGLWPSSPDSAAQRAAHQALVSGVLAAGLQAAMVSAEIPFGDCVMSFDAGDSDAYFTTPEEFWAGWESSDDEGDGDVQASAAGAAPVANAGLGPLPAASLSPRVPLAMPEGEALSPCPTVQLCLAPMAFRCSLDGRLCWDPVQTPGGVLYDRSSIALWLKWKRVCPVTGSSLSSADLVEDAALRGSILEWLAREGACVAQGDA